MDRFEKEGIINAFIQNYGLVRDRELFMDGINDECADSICAATITIIEMLKEDKQK